MSYEPHYTPDMSALIDKPHELLAEDLGITDDAAKKVLRLIEKRSRENQAIIIGRVLGFLIQAKNQQAMIYGFAIAAGLDQLNGAETETEIAEKMGVSRALISHYVCGARDILSGKEVGDFDNTTFRKQQSTRRTYADKTRSKVLEAKRKWLENQKA
jgi:hypothetical protein